MIRRLLAIAVTLLVSGPAWAADEAATAETPATAEEAPALDLDLDDAELESNQCYTYNQYGQNAYYYCQRDYQCRWNGRQCQPNQAPQRCEQIRDYYQCQQNGCTWDNRYGCRSGQPQPQRCEEIRDYYQCQQARCQWDNRYGCLTPGGGGREVWECTARDAGWEEHPGGHRAQGYSQYDAQNAAIRICQQPYGVHGRCVISQCQRIR